MSTNLSVDIIQTLKTNPNLKFYEIKYCGQTQCVEINLTDTNGRYSNLTIKNIKYNELFGGCLPDELTKLLLKNICLNTIKNSVNITNNLPNGLKKLKLENFYGSQLGNLPLGNLPLGLEVLELVGNCGDFCLDYLPSSLKTLVIQSNYTHSLDDLPIGLENLLIHSNYAKNLVNLPNGLKFIQIYTDSQINIKLPPSVKYVNYYEDNNWLRRFFNKSYPKVIYNDTSTYSYNMLQYHDKYIFTDGNLDKNGDSDDSGDSSDSDNYDNYDDNFNFDKVLIYNNRR